MKQSSKDTISKHFFYVHEEYSEEEGTFSPSPYMWVGSSTGMDQFAASIINNEDACMCLESLVFEKVTMVSDGRIVGNGEFALEWYRGESSEMISGLSESNMNETKDN